MIAVRYLGRFLLCLLVMPFLLWAGAALWIDGPVHRVLAGLLVVGYFLAAAYLILYVRPFLHSLFGLILLGLLVLGWWLGLKPSNDRDWQADVARLPRATLEGDTLTISNVRQFVYPNPGQVSEHWSTQSYQLSELTGFDIFFSFWGPTAYGHTLASWSFADGRHLAISIEARKESHEEYSAIKSFFRQFELYYVVSQETDVVGVRAGPRQERLELYRVFTPNDGARLMLLDYIDELNQLADEPRWYNAFGNNCTTTIWRHARSIGSSFPLDWRLLANGYVLELARELGTVNSDYDLEELRRRSDVTDKARALVAAGADDRAFSAGLRVDLPPRPTAFPEP